MDLILKLISNLEFWCGDVLTSYWYLLSALPWIYIVAFRFSLFWGSLLSDKVVIYGLEITIGIKTYFLRLWSWGEWSLMLKISNVSRITSLSYINILMSFEINLPPSRTLIYFLTAFKNIENSLPLLTARTRSLALNR